MDGVIVINKERGMTSRDVVNEICKLFNTKKVGHTGTLDPIAEGVLVVCLGKATKLVELLTSNDKTYVATVKLGVLTDTLDISGNVIEERKCSIFKEKLEKVLESFIGEYEQEVPIYSAVKINGKKLYEYARENKEVKLPKRIVEIKDIKLLSFDDDEYSFEVSVSKGTYIRSLIKDINDKLGVIGIMSKLVRIKQGKFKIEDAYKLSDIKNNNYKIIPIESVIDDINSVEIEDDLYGKVKNGQILDNSYKSNIIAFKYMDKLVAIYKTYEKDKTKIKPYKMFV